MSEMEETVSFTRMADGMSADYALLARREAEYVGEVAPVPRSHAGTARMHARAAR